MKNLSLIIAIMFCSMSFAQPNEKRKELRESLTPQQEASLKSKRMALELDLTEGQQESVYQLFLKNAEERPDKKSREEMEKLSSQQRIALKEKRLDKQLATKRALKEILDTDQYVLFQENMEKRKRMMKRKMRKRKE